MRNLQITPALYYGFSALGLDSSGGNPGRIGIDIHPTVSEEACECLPACLSKFYRQTRGRGDRCHHRKPARESFLHDFEGASATQHEDVPIERQKALEQTVTENFIDGVMTAHVLAQND